MEGRVQGDTPTGARARLDGAGDRVANEQHPRTAGELPGLDHSTVLQCHLGPGRDVESGLDDAVVPERDADPRLGAQQTAFADADPVAATSGERSHDRGAAADVRAVADHDALHYAALHHGGPQRPGVEVDEALVHHRGALGQVGTQPDPVGVGDTDPARHHVVGHPGELVDAEDLDGSGVAQTQAGALAVLDVAGAHVGPHDVGEHAEEAVKVD